MDVIFDGSKIWVANNGSDSVSILRARDGSLLTEFKTERQPVDFAFDGRQMWLTHSAEDIVTRHRDRDGSLSGVFHLQDGPEGILFDGTSIWVSNFNSGTVGKISHTR